MSDWRHSGLVVREARPRDLDAIARLENESFDTDRVSRRSLREFLRAKHRPVVAATIDGELAGYALVALRKHARAVRIYSLAVDPRFARRGVGRALLRACEAYGRRHGRSALTLEVRYDNAAAIALYESSGFRQFGEHARYYADGATALRYEKSLVLAPCRESGNNPPAEGVPTLRGASRPRNVGRKDAG
jgi:ribosomal-protein-alanine acetyltransferase